MESICVLGVAADHFRDSLEVGMVGTLHEHKGGRLGRRHVSPTLFHPFQRDVPVERGHGGHSVHNHVHIVACDEQGGCERSEEWSC